MLIEVFRAGSPAAQAAGITAADLADVAAFDCANNPVPNVIGHPRNDSPAHGAIRGFKVEGDGLNAKLFADVPDDLPAFKPIVEGIKEKSILGRSMAFFGRRHPSNPTPGKIAPKHLGFLGGAAPGVAGMPPLAAYFAADPEATLTFNAEGALEVTGDPLDAVVFDAAPDAPTGVVTITDTPPATPPAPSKESTVTEQEIADREAKLKADQEAHDARVAQFAASQKSARETANAATVEALVQGGQVLPADKADLVNAFNAVDGDDVIAFAADANRKASPVSIIAGILAKAGKAVPAAGGDRLSPDGENHEFSADPNGRAAELEKARQERRDAYKAGARK